MSTTFLFIAIAFLSVVGIASYVILMVFYPEWVGITGKIALEAEKSHTGDESAAAGEKDKSFLSQIENETNIKASSSGTSQEG